MKNIKLIIFDLDGTLINAYPAITASFNYTMKQLGLPGQSAQAIKRAVGWGDSNLVKPFVCPRELAKALQIYRRHHKKSLLHHSRLFPGVMQLLKQLKQKGYILGVASNRPTYFSLLLLRHLKIRKLFNMVLCADKASRPKPYPDILKTIMKHFNIGPAQTAYVGDMVVDVQAGRSAHVFTIALTSGSSSKAELLHEKPELILNRVAQIKKLFL